MANNGRGRNVTGTSKELNKRGSGLNSGPVGSGGYEGRPGKTISGKRVKKAR